MLSVIKLLEKKLISFASKHLTRQGQEVYKLHALIGHAYQSYPVMPYVTGC